MKKLPGVSFMIRARDEAHALRESLLSLRDLDVPHMIHVVLHRCTDNSATVVRECAAAGLPVSLLTYNTEISRAGLETVATPDSHPNSLIAFYNFCLAATTRQWVFKWDADFRATPELITFLNRELDPALTDPRAYRFNARNSDGKDNLEPYLCNATRSYMKHVLWEVPLYSHAPELIDAAHICIDHASSLDDLKPYWQQPAWFSDGTDIVIEERHKRLLSALGISAEQPGAARAGDVACDQIYMTLRDNWREWLRLDLVTN